MRFKFRIYLSYQKPWSNHWRSNSIGGWAPYFSNAGMLRSSTKMHIFLLPTGPYIPFLLLVKKERKWYNKTNKIYYDRQSKGCSLCVIWRAGLILSRQKSIILNNICFTRCHDNCFQMNVKKKENYINPTPLKIYFWRSQFIV